ncbi:MAG: response regulator [Rhodospirillales bacterium]|nr:response regulator [Rhodospirillales bacterium]
MGTGSLETLVILVVARHPLLRRMLRDVLWRLGAREVVLAADTDTALEIAADRPPDLIVAVWSPHCDGLGLIAALRAESSEVPVLLCTAYEPERHAEALAAGAAATVALPLSVPSFYEGVLEATRLTWL